MSYFALLTEALRIARERGIRSSARFLHQHGVCAEDRRKVLEAIRPRMGSPR
jgi:hypothetical protein